MGVRRNRNSSKLGKEDEKGVLTYLSGKGGGTWERRVWKLAASDSDPSALWKYCSVLVADTSRIESDITPSAVVPLRSVFRCPSEMLQVWPDRNGSSTFLSCLEILETSLARILWHLILKHFIVKFLNITVSAASKVDAKACSDHLSFIPLARGNEKNTFM